MAADASSAKSCAVLVVEGSKPLASRPTVVDPSFNSVTLCCATARYFARLPKAQTASVSAMLLAEGRSIAARASRSVNRMPE